MHTYANTAPRISTHTRTRIHAHTHEDQFRHTRTRMFAMTQTGRCTHTRSYKPPYPSQGAQAQRIACGKGQRSRLHFGRLIFSCSDSACRSRHIIIIIIVIIIIIIITLLC